MSNPSRGAVLAIPFLRDAPEAARRALLAGGRMTQAASGSQIMRQGDAATDLVILLEGRLRVSVMSLGGRELTFRLLEPIQPVGEVAVLDGGPRTANVQAIAPSRLLVLPRAHCLEMLALHPELALCMMRVLCARLRDTSLGLERVATQRLPSRMAHLLLNLAAEYGRPSPSGGVLLPMRLSQGDMAALVAATREAVNKQLAEWREAGVLALERGQIVICDAGALVEASE